MNQPAANNQDSLSAYNPFEKSVPSSQVLYLFLVYNVFLLCGFLIGVVQIKLLEIGV